MAKMTKGGGDGPKPKTYRTPADSARAAGARYDHKSGELVKKTRNFLNRDVEVPIKGSRQIMERTRAINQARAKAKPAARKTGGRSK